MKISCVQEQHVLQEVSEARNFCGLREGTNVDVERRGRLIGACIVDQEGLQLVWKDY